MQPEATAHDVALVALSRVPGLGPRQISRLIEQVGSGEAALDAVETASTEQLGLGTSAAPVRGRVSIGRPELRAAREVIDDARSMGLRVLTLGTRQYPRSLLALTDPPPVLFVKGDGDFDHRRCVAIVGTRKASSYGRRSAYALARELGGWGWTVTSGMARGVDASAHEGALDGGGGSIGVLGTGHAHEYPATNRDLYRRMRADGLLVSEFEPPAPPTRHTFPRRNRIIAALARAVVVVEAGERSGALITAEYALDLGREVLCVPGRIDERGSAGSIRLLRQGAGIVARARDVFDALGWLHNETAEQAASPPAPSESADLGRRVVSLLGTHELSPDEIALRLDTPIEATLRAVGRLELEGWLERQGAGRFSVVASRLGR